MLTAGGARQPPQRLEARRQLVAAPQQLAVLRQQRRAGARRQPQHLHRARPARRERRRAERQQLGGAPQQRGRVDAARRQQAGEAARVGRERAGVAHEQLRVRRDDAPQRLVVVAAVAALGEAQQLAQRAVAVCGECVMRVCMLDWPVIRLQRW